MQNMVITMYNNLRATDNRNLVVWKTDQFRSKCICKFSFQNVKIWYFQRILEFDFTKTQDRDGKTYYKTHTDFRFGVGRICWCQSKIEATLIMIVIPISLE
jgi:hypothetical protein